jgi:hypothetical protein
MRADLFSDRKCVHIKLTKDVHFALRATLFKHNISMQELFEEFARLVASDTPKGKSIIESIVTRKIKESISGIRVKRDRSMGELDSETLYNMINKSSEKEK